MGRALQHIALNCRDRKAQEWFYSAHFGFTRARVFEAGRPDEFVMLKLGDLRLELFQCRDVPPDARGGEQPVGFKHLCFELPDVAAKADELRAVGLRPGPVIDCSHQVPGLKICFFEDPEGNRVELLEGWKDDPAPPALQ
jgi:glyoxylase I family protein